MGARGACSTKAARGSISLTEYRVADASALAPIDGSDNDSRTCQQEGNTMAGQPMTDTQHDLEPERDPDRLAVSDSLVVGICLALAAMIIVAALIVGTIHDAGI